MTIDSQHTAESVRSASVGAIADERQEQRDALFAVEGMKCASCAMRIEKGLKKVPGVQAASDITLVNGNLKSVATEIALAPATHRTIKQNLVWAFAYNIILVPLAIVSPLLSFLQENAPISAAAAMALL